MHSDALSDSLQLLYEVFIYSGWHPLPHTSKHLYSVFKCAPSSVSAEYLLARHVDGEGLVKPSGALMTRILRYPICTQAVLEALFRLPYYSITEKNISGTIELPRRLFRTLSPRSARPWSAQDKPLPFLRYVYDHPRIPPPNPNCWDGYALTRAVAAGFVPLVKFLLEQGASPACKGSIAVHAAIRRKSLPLVKMLIEPDTTPVIHANSIGKGVGDSFHAGKGKRQRQEDVQLVKRSSKRRRLEDRVPVDQQMLRTAVACDARDIVKYFMDEKFCMPDMQTVRLMRN